MASTINLFGFMTSDDKQFCKTLGTRIARLRKEQGLSQQALADELGIPQQTLAQYEVGRARMAVSLLPVLARFFGVAVDDLVGFKHGTSKRGPTPLMQRQIEKLNRLPKAKQRVVMDMLKGVLQQ